MGNEDKGVQGEYVEVWADFNGLFSELLCLTHSDHCLGSKGGNVQMSPGMKVMAFDEDLNENGVRDDLIATGVVEQAPQWLACKGSRWVLRIDANGVRNRSDLKK
jgi:hypothetical protein